jgi:hypothetical protein
MSIDRLRYEIHLMGRKVILTPVLVMLGFALFAVLLAYLKVWPDRFLSAGVEMMLPITAAVVVATIVVQDPMLELLLTTPRQYAALSLLRIGLIVAWTACVALLSELILTSAGLGYMTRLAGQTPVLQFLIAQLTWLAPLLWCIGIGLCLALLLHSRTASGALLGGIWILETIYKDFFYLTTWLRPVFLFPTTLWALNTPLPWTQFMPWLDNRFEVLGTGLLALLLCWLLLRQPERLLKGSSEE